MKALWLEDQELCFRYDVPVPIPSNDEALIKVVLAGICATDLEQQSGYYPFRGIPGHEFVGIVEESIERPALIGQRVVGEINIACGVCDLCKAGIDNHCKNRKVIGIRDHDGCFGEYLVLPIRNIHPVPEQVPDEFAVFTEPIAAALQILEQVHIRPSDKVLIIGAGRLGQLIARVVALIPCQLFVSTRYSSQEESLRKLGVQALHEDDLPTGEMDVVIEATGSPKGFLTAAKAVKPRGTIVIKSTYKAPGEINLSPIVVNENCIVGSRCGPFPPVLQLLSEGIIDLSGLVSEFYPIKEGIQAYKKARDPGIFKVLLKM